MTELLAPAGNIEKLKYVYRYGADAAYIGVGSFSLRAKADNFSREEASLISEIKGNKKLYCALNVYFHNQDIKRLEKEIESFQVYPFDAFIISDIGILPLMKRYFPDTELHLSTQANCTNGEAAKLYRDLGFSRIILGREVGLKEIDEIKSTAPELELEVFVHGAMCLAYSGRCFLSRWMADRSGNDGTCAHSCRWEYRVLEEKERPGEYYPIEEGDGFTTIMSSRDLCMIDHLKELKDVGVDSFKIEGRMKSIYYAAIVTRAYRKALDRLTGKEISGYKGFREELDKVSHREYSTGFYFGKQEIEKPTEISYERQYRFMGIIGEKVGDGEYELIVKNQIVPGEEIEYVGPDVLFLKDSSFILIDPEGKEVSQADHGKEYTLKTAIPIQPGYIVRKANPRGLH